MNINKVVSVILLLIMITGVSFAQSEGGKAISPDKKKLILRFIDVSGTADIPNQIVTDLIGSVKTQISNVPDKFYEDFKKNTKISDFIEMLVPIYDELFTDSELKDLISFFETSTGKKFVGLSNKMYQESYKISEKWSTNVSNDLIDKLKKEGYIKDEAPEEVSPAPQEEKK